MPRRETHVDGERAREQKRPRRIGDRGQDRRREARYDRRDEEETDHVTRERPEAERE